MTGALIDTRLGLANRRSGKVRDLYDVRLEDGSDALLIVATDRVSAFDVIMANGLPGKGVILTQLSRFWFDYFADQVGHHLLSTDVDEVPGLTPTEREQLRGRIMLCRKTRVIPIECVARGYLTGSGWKDYQRTGALCGIALPPGLINSERLAEPIFTPATKAATGHDENVSFAAASERVGSQVMAWLRDATLRLYVRARDYAWDRGIILADTKLEFGLHDESAEPLLIDEIFTPDSSRFWPAEGYHPGDEQPSFDKQIVRNYLEDLVARGQWNREPPGPELPGHVLERTLARYLDAYRMLTGDELTL